MSFMQYDKDFLLELDKIPNKTTYAKITALQFNETPIESIEGRVTGGSINIDGTSALRRTCSLTLVAEDINYNDYYWGLNTKFKLEIGLENSIAPDLPNIIWFNQGIYLITDFSTSHSTSDFNISISGKDKMCLLNGDIGGELTAETDFGKIEEEDQDGNWTIRPILITEIIKNTVHTYAGEPYHNIIINDLDAYGLELLEYRADIPMYFYRQSAIDASAVFENATMDGSKKCWVKRQGENAWTQTTLEELTYNDYETLTESITGGTTASEVKFGEKDEISYYVAKIEYGQTAGYRITDLTYAGDLIGKVGESITSILDKIRNMLVEFEYFYNLEGQFVFQKKQSYLSTPWTPIENSENGLPAVIYNYSTDSSSTYTFSGGELISSFNNSPDLLNVRNDFSIWGTRQTISGAEVPVHMRYAIDKKPLKYTSIEVKDEEVVEYNKKYGTTLTGQSSVQYRYSPDEYKEGTDNKGNKLVNCDWREILYQMAVDYYKYNFLDNFELKVIAANKELYPQGKTGYEAYYTDIQGFWRELFNPELGDQLNTAKNELSVLNNRESKDDGTPLYENSVYGLEYQIIQDTNDLTYVWNWFNNPPKKNPSTDNPITNEDVQSYYNSLSILNERINLNKNRLNQSQEKIYDLEDRIKTQEYKIENYYYNKSDGAKLYWNKTVFEKPDQLNFWIDFLDSIGDIEKYSVKAIGCRPKTINETSLKGIYFRETPSVIFVTEVGENQSAMGYRYIQVRDIDSMFSISSQGKSIKDKLDELLYEHSYCTESVSISAIPVYYLEPNTRIHIYDEKTGLNSDYILNRITLPLSYNGTMNITAIKVVDNII